MHFYLTIKLRLSIGIGRPVVGVLAAVGYAGVGTVSWLWPYSIRPRDLWPGNLTWPDLVIEHWMAVDSDPRLYLAQPNKTADPITSDLAILLLCCDLCCTSVIGAVLLLCRMRISCSWRGISWLTLCRLLLLMPLKYFDYYLHSAFVAGRFISSVMRTILLIFV